MGQTDSKLVLRHGKGELRKTPMDEFLWCHGETESPCDVTIRPYDGEEIKGDLAMIREGDLPMELQRFSFTNVYMLHFNVWYDAYSGGTPMSRTQASFGATGHVLEYRVSFKPSCVQMWDLQFNGARLTIPVISIPGDVEGWFKEHGIVHQP